MTDISVVHATRERHVQAQLIMSSWLGLADEPGRIEWLFGIDDDDHESLDRLSNLPGPARVVMNGGDRTSIGASNACLAEAQGAVVIQCSDDYWAPRHWDSLVMSYLKPFADRGLPAVLGTGDPNGSPSDNPKYVGTGLLTMVCATRAYLEKIGYFYYPEYPGVMVDLDFTQKAAADHALVDAYEHLHFIHEWHGGEGDPKRDETYKRHLSDENGRRGVAVYQRRLAALFPDIDKSGNPKPFADDDARAAFVQGDYAEARKRVERDLNVYTSFCGGRFNYSFGSWLWHECTKRLGGS